MSATTDTPVLTYFDGRGLAEVPRLLLAAANVVYTDDRIPIAAGPSKGPEWEALKPTLPYGQVPILKTHGRVIAQSQAIVRYLARTYHLDGDSALDNAILDAANETIVDIRKKYYADKSDEEKKKAFWAEYLPKQLGLIENNIVASASSPWFLGGNRMTYVDIALYYQLWSFRTENAEAVDAAVNAHPKIAALIKGVAEHENIAKYVASRKQTEW